MVKFGKGFMATIRALTSPEDGVALDAYVDDWKPKPMPLPPHFKRDVREMSDAEILEFAQWSQDHGQSVGVGMDLNPENMDRFMEAFECYRCGKCCKGPLLDGIALLPSDVKRLAGHVRMHPDKFVKKYAPVKRAGRYCVMPYPCQFFTGKGCSVYPIRPISCRTFPLDFHLGGHYDELAVQAFCPAAKDFFIFSAKARREAWRGQ